MGKNIRPQASKYRGEAGTGQIRQATNVQMHNFRAKIILKTVIYFRNSTEILY